MSDLRSARKISQLLIDRLRIGGCIALLDAANVDHKGWRAMVRTVPVIVSTGRLQCSKCRLRSRQITGLKRLSQCIERLRPIRTRKWF